MAVSAPVDCEPLVASLPDHAPEAMHEVALDVDQFNVELPPLATVLGLALNVTIGAAAATVTMTDCVAHPPWPQQARVYSVVLASAPVGCDPLIGIEPAQPPVASQVVAFWAFHVSVEFAPTPMVDGAAVSVTVGRAAATTTSVDSVTDPPGPVQVSV